MPARTGSPGSVATRPPGLKPVTAVSFSSSGVGGLTPSSCRSTTLRRRLVAAESPACLDAWSDALVHHLMEKWDDDLGGRSTRDFIEENVVEAIADALDGVMDDANAGSVHLSLDVDAGAGVTGQDSIICRIS